MPTPSQPDPLVPSALDALLEADLRQCLRRGGHAASELAPLAVRLGLVQGTTQPRLTDPQLVLVAADHGLAVDGAGPPGATTAARVQELLSGKHPVAVLAQARRIDLKVVDAGLADRLDAHEGLLVRKIAHGTRNARLTAAMTLEQAHATLRAGAEIASVLPGNTVLCGGLGVGGDLSAALVLAQLADRSVRSFAAAQAGVESAELAHRLAIAQGVRGRHQKAGDAIEVLAACGGFEIGMLAGMLLAVAGQRRLAVVDGLAACAALKIAARIAPSVVDYVVFAGSRAHDGFDAAVALFDARPLLTVGESSVDGMGAVLAWPLVEAAAELLGSPEATSTLWPMSDWDGGRESEAAALA